MKSWTRRDILKNSFVMGATVTVGMGFMEVHQPQVNCIRPPGALDEDDFLSTCIRCGRCASACPNHAITSFTEKSGKPFSLKPGRGQDGTPVVFPRMQSCNLCMGDKGELLRCTEACPSGALQLVRKTPEEIQKNVSMGTAFVDTNLCHSYNGRSCGVCIRACPFQGKALRADIMETPVLNTDYCVGCGLCERSCIRYPQAIFVKPREE